MKISKISIVLISAIALMAQFVGKFFSSTGKDWYRTLNLPSVTPPDWIFGVAWTIIYILSAICAILVWNFAIKNSNFIMTVFGINLFLNIFWTYIFFYKHNILGGLVVAILLEISVLILMFEIFKTSKKTSLLLAPYAIWVAFAIILNYLIWIIN